MDMKRIFLFVLILTVGLTVVAAADVADDDSSPAIDTPQTVEETSNIEPAVQEVQKVDKNTLKNDPSNDVVISQSVTITQSDLVTYNNKNWTVNGGVTVSADNDVTFNNVAITVAGDYVTLDKLVINTNNNTKLIDATGTNNLTITDSSLTLRNDGTSGNNKAIGIDLTDANNVSISNSYIKVEAPSQTQQWYNTTPIDWYSVLEVSAILVNNGENITIDHNTIDILNTTEKVVNSTMPAITIKNSTENINVTFNTIYATGAQYVYGIMMNDGVANAALKNNTITVIDKLYVAGIDASTATNSVVSGNHITVTSNGQSSYDSDNGEESLAYGIISNTYTTGNENNKICKNEIIATAHVIYAIEVYRGNNITVCSNTLQGNGNKTMGVGFAHTNNSKIINNGMILTGTTEVNHTFYEEITPVNAGIVFTNQSNDNLIQGNSIFIYAYGDDNVYAVNLQNSSYDTVDGNVLYAIYASDYSYKLGNDAIVQDALCSDNTIGNNEILDTYPCTCGCMVISPQNTDNTQSSQKTIKKDEDILVVDNNNWKQYILSNMVGMADMLLTVPFDCRYFPTNAKIILNLTSKGSITFSAYTSNPITLLEAHYTSGKVQTIGGLYTFNNTYMPNIRIQIDQSGYVINTTLQSITPNVGNILIENNTIITLQQEPIKITKNIGTITVKNNYMVGAKNNIAVFAQSLYENQYYNENWIIENNTPTYDTGYVLNNSNYATYFDEETNILKDEYADTVLFAFEKITKPVIINSKGTLSGLRDVGGYTSVSFIEGSDNSIIEDTIVDKITLNTANNIKINHNTMTAEDSVIEILNSAEGIIQNNTINTNNPYTVIIDESSFSITVTDNELIASQLKGDKSVDADKQQNTIKDNTPKPVPVLKVDTTSFTIGSIANITASITLDDEVATDINNGKVVFKVNGKTLKDSDGKVIYAKVVNGVATIENFKVPQSWTKNGTTIQATYTGSAQCGKLTSNATEISITATEPAITTENVTTTANSQITLTATITDGDKQINTGKVVFKTNGKTIKDENGKVIYAKVTNGTATTNYTIPENMKTGNYTITAVFTSPNYDKKLEANSTLTVTA